MQEELNVYKVENSRDWERWKREGGEEKPKIEVELFIGYMNLH